MKLTLLTAGETNCRRLTPDQAYVVATRSGRQLYASAKREDAERFMEKYKRKRNKMNKKKEPCTDQDLVDNYSKGTQEQPSISSPRFIERFKRRKRK